MTQFAAYASRYTGKERDAESGNDYFGARYYASSMGRWLSPDWSAKEEPVPYAHLDDPQSLNLYSYVLNNPLAKADLDGHGCPPDCSDQQAPGGSANPANSSFLNWVKGETAGLVEYGKQAFNLLSATPYIGPLFGAGSAAVSAAQGKTGEAATSAALAALPAAGLAGDAAKGAQLLSDASKAGDAISMTQAVEKGAAHVGDGLMEETGKGTNFQFRNTTTDASGSTVTKIGRFDVNPADPHVAKEGAHLNLETQVNGKQVGNQHISIDPNTVRPGDHP